MMSEWYLFQFAPASQKGCQLMYSAVTDDASMMNEFIKQHNLKNGYKYVQVLSDKELDELDIDKDIGDVLKKYTLGSNFHRNKLYDLVTTENLISEATMSAVSQLSASAVLGSLITIDIPLVNHIKEVVDKIDFGIAFDLCNIPEEDSTDYVSRNPKHWKFASESYPSEQFIYSEGPDDSLLYDAVFEDAQYSAIYPITIESYIEFFVSILTDEYD